jgi:hypothetical protein
MRARNFFYDGGNLPKNILNQFGGTFGGPIKKNKLFFADLGTHRPPPERFGFPDAAQRSAPRRRLSDFGTNVYDPATGAASGTRPASVPWTAHPGQPHRPRRRYHARPADRPQLRWPASWFQPDSEQSLSPAELMSSIAITPTSR